VEERFLVIAFGCCDNLHVQELQTCLQSCSKRLSFNPVVREGHWQTATVRVTNAGHAMLVVVMHPQYLSAVSIIQIVTGAEVVSQNCYTSDRNVRL